MVYKKKKGCIKICFWLFTDDYDFVQVSVGSCSVSVCGGGGADAH